MRERTAETGEHGNFIPPTDREKSINELYHSFMQFEEPQHLVVFTDSDHAGCLRTRKSTSSFKIMYGQHLPRSASSTQAVISLRSGESEFYSLVKGVAAGLGAVTMLRDLGVELTGDATVEVEGGRNGRQRSGNAKRCRANQTHRHTDLMGPETGAGRKGQSLEDTWQREPSRFGIKSIWMQLRSRNTLRNASSHFELADLI